MRSTQIKLLATFLLAVLFSLMAWMVLKNEKRKIIESQKTKPVLVANKFIKANTPLKPSMVKIKSIPLDYIEPTALTQPKDLLSPEGETLFKSTMALLKGEQIQKSRLRDKRLNFGLAWTLAPSETAATFRLSQEQAVGGWVQPGDEVHVFGIFGPQQGWSKPVAKLLFTNLRVIAINHQGINHNSKEQMNGFKMIESEQLLITLAIPVQIVADLSLIHETGKIKLALASLGSDTIVNKIQANSHY